MQSKQKQNKQSAHSVAAHNNSSAVSMLIDAVAELGLPRPVTEHRFHPTRRWRLDIAWPKYKLAVEVDGGVWIGGRHVRAAGYEADCAKINAATLMGWRVLRFTPGMVARGEACLAICEAFEKAVKSTGVKKEAPTGEAECRSARDQRR